MSEIQLEMQTETRRKCLIYGSADDCVISRFNTRKTRNEDDIIRLAQRIERNSFEVTRALWVYENGDGKYEVFAGGNRLEAARKTSHKDNVPLLVHEGYTNEEIAQLEAQDNENDEYHVKVSVVDIWAEYARLRDEEGWTQKQIARAKNVPRSTVSERCKWHDELPIEIKKSVEQEKLSEGHLRIITTLSNVRHFSSWLTTEELWLDLAKKAVKEQLSVSKLKKEVDRWKKIIDLAEQTYDNFAEQEKRYEFSGEGVEEVCMEYEYNPREEFVLLLKKYEANSQAKVKKAASEINAEIIRQSRNYSAYLRRRDDAEERERQKLEEEQRKRELEEKYANIPICGDAFEILPTLDILADTIILDPPYFTSQGETNEFLTDKGEWDKELSPTEQEEYYTKLLRLCGERLQDNGTIWCFGTYHNIFAFGQSLRKLGFYILNAITWAKSNVKPLNLMNDTKFVPSSEFIIWARKSAEISNHTYNFETIKELNDGNNMWDVWEFSTERKTEHPTEKPEKLFELMILACTNEGDVVIDPFLGSGTTAVVCKRLQRVCYGIEIEKKWCEAIEQRLDEESYE